MRRTARCASASRTCEGNGTDRQVEPAVGVLWIVRMITSGVPDFLENTEERREKHRIKLTPLLGHHHLEDFILFHRAAIGAIARESVVNINYRQNPSRLRDRVAGKS